LNQNRKPESRIDGLLRRFRLGPRLVLLIAVPLLALTAVVLIDSQNRVERVQELREFENEVAVASEMASVVEALQVERLLAVNANDTQSDGDADALRSAWSDTDAALARLVARGSTAQLGSELVEALDEFREQPFNTTNTRSDIATLYLPIIDRSIAQAGSIEARTNHREVRGQVAAWVAVLTTVEAARVDQLDVAGALAAQGVAGSMSSDQRVLVGAGHANELQALERFVVYAEPEAADRFRSIATTATWRQTVEMRDAIVSGRSDLPEPAAWAEVSEQRIAILHELEAEERQRLRDTVSAATSAGTRTLIGMASFTAFVLLLGALAAFLLRSSIVGPLRRLEETAGAMSRGTTSEAQASGSDELTEVARSFDTLHSTMSQLWSESRRVKAATDSGDLHQRFDDHQYNGDWSRLVRGFNDTLDSLASTSFALQRQLDSQNLLNSLSTSARVATTDTLVDVGVDAAMQIPGSRAAWVLSHPDKPDDVRGMVTSTQTLPETSDDYPLVAASVHGIQGPVGVLAVEFDTEQPPDDHAVETVDAIARILSQAHRAKTAEDQVAYQSIHDRLTSLPNKAFFQIRLDEMLAAPPGAPITVFCVEPRRIELFEATYGGRGRDTLLRVAAQRINATGGTGALVARTESPEYSLAVQTREDPAEIAQRLHKAFDEPVSLGIEVVHVDVAIGFATSGGDHFCYSSSDDLLADAAIATRRMATDSSQNIVAFEPCMRDEALRRVELQQWLETTIRDHELGVYFQPITDVRTGRWVGVEALARGLDDDGNPISPGEFIPVAEESGLIGSLGEQVLRKSCEAATRLPDDTMTMSVNISVQQMQSESVVASVALALSESGLAPERLRIEVTESALVAEEDTAIIARLEALRRLGVSIAIDDFGTGYSSLGYLSRLPVQVVKLDMSLVRGLDSDDSSAAVVARAIEMAHDLGLQVVAEGVERETQRERLEEFGCDYAQGWLYSKAVPLPDLRALWASLDQAETAAR
jgi:EAL domain-containing protein (putative c-di-GMP-specific phosphodiesterase class I)/GGDEF domain-containing protein